MTNPLNPVELEAELHKTVNSISASIPKVSEQYDHFKTAELEFKLAYAMAFREAEGSIEDRKQQAVFDTQMEAERLKDAEVLYKRVSGYQRAYRDKLSALQSVSKSVVAAYNTAGAHG